MKKKIFLEIRKKLVSFGIATDSQIQGLSKSEIDQLELYAMSPLPEIYKEFLTTMGRRAGAFFQGTDIFFESIINNRVAAVELLEEDRSDFKLSQNDFIFASHQGYQFMYFHLNENDDPPIFYYDEGEKYPYQKWDKFSDFITESVDDYLNVPT